MVLWRAADGFTAARRKRLSSAPGRCPAKARAAAPSGRMQPCCWPWLCYVDGVPMCKVGKGQVLAGAYCERGVSSASAPTLRVLQASLGNLAQTVLARLERTERTRRPLLALRYSKVHLRGGQVQQRAHSSVFAGCASPFTSRARFEPRLCHSDPCMPCRACRPISSHVLDVHAQ